GFTLRRLWWLLRRSPLGRVACAPGHHPRRHVPAALDHRQGLPQRARSFRFRHRHVARTGFWRVPAQGAHPCRKLPAHRACALVADAKKPRALSTRLAQVAASRRALLLCAATSVIGAARDPLAALPDLRRSATGVLADGGGLAQSP